MKKRLYGKSGEEHLSRLLPYWGLSWKGNVPTEALENQTVTVSGISGRGIGHIAALLAHTGVNVKNKSTGTGRHPHFSIRFTEHTRGAITLTTENTTYHLKPLRKKTDDVQSWIHKRLWLPVHRQETTLTLHPNEWANTPEWIGYFILQRFLQDSFQPLSHVTFSEYEHLVTTVLRPLNPTFANCQLSLGEQSENDWPQFPPGSERSGPDLQRDDARNDFLHSHHDTESEHTEPINPFKTPHEQTGNPIDPFRKQKQKTEKSVIHPFRKKRK